MGGHKNILLRSYNEKYMNAVTAVGLGQTWKGCMLVISFETQCKLHPLLSFLLYYGVLHAGNWIFLGPSSRSFCFKLHLLKTLTKKQKGKS